jgi:serine/threonine-protein kinase RsbW
MVQTLTLPASLDALAALHPFVQSASPSLSEPLVSQIVLAVHELCTNIIRHAYAGADGEIYMEATWKPGSITFLIRDHAPRAFTLPRTIVQPDPASLPEGGWGIYIVHKVMNQVEYRRLHNGNEWILKKYLDHGWED